MPFDKWFQDSFNRLILYICITFLYGFIIYAFKDNNQFYGLNKNNDLLDCVFYASIVFTGSGYAEIYPQTVVSKLIILSLSLSKLYIMIMPLEVFPVESFEINNKDSINLNDIIDVMNQYNEYIPRK